MRVAVIGGRLQGLEAVYLAKKAGWDVLLIDKCLDIPASILADSFCHLNVESKEELSPVLKGVDIIIPALENWRALGCLSDTARKLNIPFAFDLHAYDISSSKNRSDRLFAEIGIPAPCPWPDCSFPLIAKPSSASGSEGVVRLKNEKELTQFMDQTGGDIERWVIQEYLWGPSYSIEVLGCRGQYLPLQVTTLEMDSIYDCKRVVAPSDLSTDLKVQFADIAVQIARSIELNGIMDVEVILHNDILKVLEIDARLPSQTPTAVFHSTGVNMLELLVHSFLNGRIPGGIAVHEKRFAIFEHIVVSLGKLEVCGEHAVSGAGPLCFREGFFGADEALTNYRPDKANWMATLIINGKNRDEAYQKRSTVIQNIGAAVNAKCYIDSVPEMEGARP